MSRARLAVGGAISAALVTLLLASVDLAALGRQLGRTQWGWALAGAGLGVLALWVRARRWRYLFPPEDAPPALVPAIMIGYMANNLLPLRAGEVVRVYVVVRRWGQGLWTTLATLVVERVLDSLVVVLILGILVLLIPVPSVARWGALTLLALDVVAAGVLVTLGARPRHLGRLLESLGRRWPRLSSRVREAADRFARGLDGVRAPAHLAPLAGWTVLAWLVPALGAWIMMRAAHLDLPWIAGWTVLAFVGLGVSVPSAPGYVGVFHYAAVLALDIFAVERAASLGYAILLHAAQVLPITLVGWIYLLREHLSLREAARLPAAPGADPKPAPTGPPGCP